MRPRHFNRNLFYKYMLSKRGKIFELLTVLFLIGLGVMARFLPHPPNFVPIAALALFGGVYLPRKLAFVTPLAAMLISDIFIGFYDVLVMISVYFSFLLVAALGLWLRKHKKWYTVGGSATVSALLFFIITNFAVWVFTPWYSKTVAGIIQCYLLALPFFRNTLLSDLFYTFSFFGIYELANLWFKQRFTIRQARQALVKRY